MSDETSKYDMNTTLLIVTTVLTSLSTFMLGVRCRIRKTPLGFLASWSPAKSSRAPPSPLHEVVVHSTSTDVDRHMQTVGGPVTYLETPHSSRRNSFAEYHDRNSGFNEISNLNIMNPNTLGSPNINVLNPTQNPNHLPQMQTTISVPQHDRRSSSQAEQMLAYSRSFVEETCKYNDLNV